MEEAKTTGIARSKIKYTGITRAIDDACRISIPKELSKTLNFKPGDLISMYYSNNEGFEGLVLTKESLIQNVQSIKVQNAIRSLTSENMTLSEVMTLYKTKQNILYDFRNAIYQLAKIQIKGGSAMSDSEIELQVAKSNNLVASCLLEKYLQYKRELAVFLNSEIKFNNFYVEDSESQFNNFYEDSEDKKGDSDGEDN